MKIGTVEVELKPKDIEEIKNKIKEDLINEGFVEVVRCKDCKYCVDDKYDTGYGVQPHFMCDYTESGVNPDDYCSYGERKDGDKE